MKKIFLIIVSICLILITISISYYFVIFLPQKERQNEIIIKKIEQQTKNIRNSIDNLPAPEPQNTLDMTQQFEDMRNSIIQNQQDERQNEVNCESNGGRYQGNGTCVYY